MFQAGSSGRGTAFAARHAECTFVSGSTLQDTRDRVGKLRKAAQEQGRHPDDLKVFMGVSVIVAPTEKEAREKHQEYLRYASPEAGLAHFSSSTGIDFSQFGLDEPVKTGPTRAIESVSKAFDGWTPRQLLEQHALGGRYTLIVGDPSQVADQLLKWVDEAGIDGFNLTRIVNPQSYVDFIDLVVPELQRRGRYKTAYREGTFRDKLFGQGARLPATHPAAAFRR